MNLLRLLIFFLLFAVRAYSETLKMAEQLFHEKLYGDALPLFSELLETPLVLCQVSNAGLDQRESSRGCEFVSRSVLSQYKPTYELATPGLWRGPTLHLKLDRALALVTGASLSHLIPKSWIAAIVQKNIKKVKNDSE
jgi:hypothetical protein